MSEPTNADETNSIKRDADKLKNVLSDFVFVGSGDYDSSAIPFHSMDVRPFPALDVGKECVFHRHPMDNDALFKTIQERLKSNGFQITGADQLGWRYVGGLFFRIKFTNASQKYLLFNQADVNILRNESLSKAWASDDYVLIVER